MNHEGTNLPIVAEIFHFGSKWWNKQQTDTVSLKFVTSFYTAGSVSTHPLTCRLLLAHPRMFSRGKQLLFTPAATPVTWNRCSAGRKTFLLPVICHLSFHIITICVWYVGVIKHVQVPAWLGGSYGLQTTGSPLLVSYWVGESEFPNDGETVT